MNERIEVLTKDRGLGSPFLTLCDDFCFDNNDWIG